MDASTKEQVRDAARYRWLRSRPTGTIEAGGVFIGQTSPTLRGGMILTEDDADKAIDDAMNGQHADASVVIARQILVGDQEGDQVLINRADLDRILTLIGGPL